MQLSSEDALRLNVLLAHDLQAIRIDDSKMVVYGLSEQGEAKVRLNPNCRDDRYLKLVRETISGQMTGSPGGYPIFLRRWTRTGQMGNEGLDRLLLLGEPEAVVAVACSQGLDAETARRAWWALPEADNARRMLQRRALLDTDIGREMAAYLVEFLPFEEEPLAMMESVRLVLQGTLVDARTRLDLWRGGKRKTAYLVGFLQTLPDALPDPVPPRADHADFTALLGPLAEAGNPYAQALLRMLGGAGQTYLKVVQQVLAKPPNQDVVNTLIDTVADYYGAIRPTAPEAVIETLLADAETLCDNCPAPELEPKPGLTEVLNRVPALHPELRAMLCLARLSYAVVRPVFSHTDSIGTLMRKKLAPVTVPLLEQIEILRTASPVYRV